MIHGEDQDLKIHVSICQQRYADLEARISKLETKIDEIKAEIAKSKHDLGRIILTASSTLIAGILGLITTILLKF